MEQTNKRENMVTGIVGAFLGSLIGVACIVLIGQMGYVASISGVIMAVCALKGYEILGGRLSKKGVAAACVLILTMTYVGNQLDWAISAASALEIGILEAFRSMGYFLDRGVIESASYWGNLALLYLFTLLGAVPTIINGLREQNQPAIPQNTPTANAEWESDAERPELQIYPAAKGWMRSLRVSYCASVFLGIFVGCGLLLAGILKDSPPTLFASLACILTSLLIILFWLRSMQALQAEAWVYVRMGQTLWRVNLSKLNMVNTCRYTTKGGVFHIVRWDGLTPEEQERASASITRTIPLLDSGQLAFSDMLRQAVLPMTDLQVEKETKWYWVVSCRTGSGRRTKWAVAKAYPDFAPAPGLEKPREPVPFRWAPLVAALLAAAAAIGIVFGVAAVLNGDPSGSGSFSGLGQGKDAPLAGTPDSTASYAYNGVTYQVDSAFEEVSESVFFDEQTGAFYYLTVENGMDEESTQRLLTELISEYRTDDTFDRFQFAYPEAASVFVPLTAADGAVYQHAILSLYFTQDLNEMVIHSGVALSEDGVLVTVGATHDGAQDVEAVTANIVYILESIELSADAGAQLTEITEENYRSLFHLAEEYGYAHIGCGYIKVPYEMFGYDAFVDVYIPYSENVEYLEDGYAIRASAHGMEVYHTIAQSEGNAQAVVDQAYAQLAASGVDIFEDGVFETEYTEEYDIAYKQVAYWEDSSETPRIALLYADRKEDGHYLYAQITYLPEQMDEDYPVLLEELSDVFALTLPLIDPFS